MDIYCTYLTVYLGNLLPPFYIGYTSLKKIENRYRGTVTSQKYKKIWKRELRDNPNLFKTFILTRHRTKREANEREHKFQRQLGVVKNPLYINLWDGLQFDRTGTKNKKPAWNKGLHTASQETRRKISEIKKGKPSPRKGAVLTDDTKELMRQNKLGRKWVTNGIDSKLIWPIDIDKYLTMGWWLGKSGKNPFRDIPGFAKQVSLLGQEAWRKKKNLL
jgi:hypothetical protein